MRRIRDRRCDRRRDYDSNTRDSFESSACLVSAVPGDQRLLEVLDPTLKIFDLRHKQPKSMLGYGRNTSIAVMTKDLNELWQIPEALSYSAK